MDDGAILKNNKADSRGAHFRGDFPAPSDLATSAYTSVRLSGGRPQVASEPVAFTRVRPGQSLLKGQPRP